jgi:hypothetical protein
MEAKSIKIGIVSENAKNDGQPIALLLERYFPAKANYVHFCESMNGSMLDTDKAFDLLKRECKKVQPDVVIFVRDLDSDTEQTLRNRYFQKCNNCDLGITQIHLLFIYEIEALALTDWQTTQDILKWKDKEQMLPEFIEIMTKDAKEFIQLYFKYAAGDMNKLAEFFNLNELKNYTVWRDFIEKISEKIE